MKKNYLVLASISLLLLLAAAPIENWKKPEPPPSFAANFKTYNLPYDASSPTDPTALATFAWQEMIALNWKATYDPANNNYERGVPVSEKKWSYQQSFPIPDGQANGSVIWETFAHRTELRPSNTSIATYDVIRNDFNSKPKYTFGSVTRDSKNAITAFTAVNVVADKGAQVDLLNCLDEDNEIGSCLLYSNVYNGANDTSTSSLTSQVLFQAKINRAGFDYRKNNLNGNPKILAAANRVGDGTGKPNFSKLKDKSGICNSDALTANGTGVICFPCAGEMIKDQAPAKTSSKSEGVIEIKTAWIKYDPRKHPNINEYFHRKAIYFGDKMANKDGSFSFLAKNDIFLLVGMHIIRKTLNVPTFIIATFEHTDLESDSFKYVSVPGGDGDYSELWKISPAKRRTSNPGYLKHQALYQSVTDQVWTDLKTVNPTHYLLHYRLVGVQGHYEQGYPQDTSQASFFMSNFAVESDNALSNFYGNFALPQQGNSDPAFFNLMIDNGTKKIVAGGCKGCHGVTQTFGTDMSFLMDKNRPAPEPDVTFLSAQEIDSVLYSPIALINTPAAARVPIVLSYIDPGKPSHYLLRHDQASNYLATNPYNDKFQQYQSTVLFDLDHYPRANFQFTNYKRLTETTATVKLQYVPFTGEPNNDYIYVAQNIPSYPGRLGLSNKSTDALTFRITMRKAGLVELTVLDPKGADLGPIIYKPTVDQFAIGVPTDTVAQFIINGVSAEAFKVINGK